jgi:hypothetical protein
VSAERTGTGVLDDIFAEGFEHPAFSTNFSPKASSPPGSLPGASRGPACAILPTPVRRISLGGMAGHPLTAEELAEAVRTMLEAQRESAHRQDAFAARMETFGARLDQQAERLDMHAARQDALALRFDQAMDRIDARFDRIDERLSTVYDLLTRKNAGFAR